MRVNIGRNVGRMVVSHSAKGSEWEDHKYIKKIDGNYYYPDNYKGGRHLEDGDEERRISTDSDMSSDLIDVVARDVIRGLFGNGADRKMALGDAYQKIQDRVNEILRSSGVGDTKLSEDKAKKVSESGDKAVKKAVSSSASMDMDQIYSAYGGLSKKDDRISSKTARANKQTSVKRGR